jgi:hypothetical protein
MTDGGRINRSTLNNTCHSANFSNTYHTDRSGILSIPPSSEADDNPPVINTTIRNVAFLTIWSRNISGK